MPRVPCDHIGLIPHPDRQFRRRKDGSASVPDVADAPPGGITLELCLAALKVQPAGEVFTPGELGRRLVRLRRRAAARLPLFADGPADTAPPRTPSAGGPASRGNPLRVRVSPTRRVEDLRVCSCARCGCRLLGESETPLARALAVRRLKTLAHLPPLVAARVGGRPYCDGCLDLPPVRIVAPRRACPC